MKEYFARFKYLYITLVVILVVTIAATAVYMTKQKAAAANKGKRMNTECLTDERVFDYADVLTDAQEDDLRELIAEKEKEVSLDIVLVTLNEDVGSSDDALMEYADQFYEDNKFGYDKPIGDGVIYVDNYYDRYVWFGTTGIAENAYTTSAINNLLDAVCDLTDANPYEAYKTYVMQVAGYMAEREAEDSIGIMVDPFSIMIIALIVAVSYVLVNLKKQEGKRTTTASTYVERTPVMNNQVDQFMTKSVTKRKIETSSSSGGGGHSGFYSFSSCFCQNDAYPFVIDIMINRSGGIASSTYTGYQIIRVITSFFLHKLFFDFFADYGLQACHHVGIRMGTYC